MKVLVTGSAGQVGSVVIEALVRRGWSVQSFDLVDGDDLCDAPAVRAAAAGCDAIVHSGAIAHDSSGTPEDIVATNVGGTWHVLRAAEAHDIPRIVYLSSAQVFGCADGEGHPAYLPVDDGHPLRAARPYGMSKRLAEEMCDMWSSRTGRTTVVLRPVMILDDHGLAAASPGDVEFGAFVHIDDVAEAVMCALTADIEGHHRMTICSAGDFDSGLAHDLIGWSPKHSWTR